MTIVLKLKYNSMIHTKKVFWFWLAITLIITGWLMFAVSHADEVGGTISNGIDQWLTVSLPCTPASVLNGDVNSTTCTIICHANYTLNGTTCTANQTSNGWGGGGWSTPKDTCPNWDYSSSLYDGICGTAPTTTGSANTGTNNDHPTTGSIIWSLFSTEFNNAYLYAYSIGVTSMPSIQEANMTWLLIRSNMAKMMVNFAVRVLSRLPDTNKVCPFNDIANESTELQGYMRLACQLGIMGIEADGTPMIGFDPNGTVTRAQFGTVLSRVLYGDQYNTPGDLYYTNHLTALQLHGIITNIDPTLQELRGYVMIMLMRAAE